MKKSILFVCGSLNQTSIMHQISSHLSGYNHFFTPFYADGFLKKLSEASWLEFTILGERHRNNTEAYLRREGLAVDYGGRARDYDLVVTGTDTLVQKNIRGNRLILVQEGIMEAESFLYLLVKYLKLPRFLANTAATGLSDVYDVFCVASQGYRDLFIRKGVKPGKIAVTGIPNFDNIVSFYDNDFPYRDYVLVATSPLRETFRRDNRVKFIRQAREVADGRQMIFKLHPLEKLNRARREIERHAPGALVLSDGNTDHMIANCAELITQYSSVTFIGLSLGKKVHSLLDLDEMRSLLPLQNGGTSANKIARICEKVINMPLEELRGRRARQRYSQRAEWGSIDLL